MAGSSMLPPGWIQDVANDCYYGPNGEIVTRMEIAKHGNIQI